MSLPVLILLAVGAILIWSAVRDKSPVQSIKDVLQGKPA